MCTVWGSQMVQIAEEFLALVRDIPKGSLPDLSDSG